MSIGAGHSLRGHRATLATRLVLPPLAGLNCPEPDAQVTLLQAYELFKNAPKAKRLAGTYREPSLHVVRCAHHCAGCAAGSSAGYAPR